MEVNGGHTGPGGSENASEDNVVRLPREWLGPREELVPVAVDDEPGDRLATPPSTQDFWGESLGDGWSTPDDGSASASRSHRDRGHGHRVVPHARAITVPRFFRRSLNRTPPAALSARPQNPAAASRRRLRPFAGMVVAVLLTVVGVGVSAGVQTGNPAPSGHASQTVPASKTATVTAGIGLDSVGSAGRLHARPAGLRSRTTAHRLTSTHRTSRATHQRTARRVSPPTRTITVEPVRYAAPAPTTSSTSTSAVPPVTTSVTPPAAAATRTSAGSHQPATGASGALGPGSSPDG